jgi:LPS sulfotransferase NodH
MALLNEMTSGETPNAWQIQFTEAFDVPEPGQASKYLIIATNPRSGSHMLGFSMRETGRMGVPLEYGNPLQLARWSQMTGKTRLEDIFAELKRRRTTANGVFSLKLHWPHVRQFGGMKGLLEFFPGAAFVLLIRNDLLAQAISYAKGHQTDIWFDGARGNGKTPWFDPALIDNCMTDILLHTSEWRYAMAHHGVTPLNLVYEETRADVPGTLRRIADFAGIDMTGAPVPETPPLRRQADDSSAEWKRRFQAEQPYRRLLGATGMASLVKRKLPTYLRLASSRRPSWL